MNNVVPLNLSGRVALVTGGTRGIGRATAVRLAAAGADVAFTYVSSEDQARVLVDDLAELGVRGRGFRVDQGRPEDAAELVDGVVAHFGRLDILVNNAGVFVQGTIDDPERDETAMSRQFAVNLHSAVAITKRAAPHLGAGGRVVLISSVAAQRAIGGPVGDYAATKAALESYGRAWAHELGRRGVTVNTVQLGFFETDMLDPGLAETLLPMIPAGRIGDPWEVAEAIAFLAGPTADYVNGAVLRIDGGMFA
jgi:3-oxoacyl-[acyl-carrier protein] reductase